MLFWKPIDAAFNLVLTHARQQDVKDAPSDQTQNTSYMARNLRGSKATSGLLVGQCAPNKAVFVAHRYVLVPKMLVLHLVAYRQKCDLVSRSYSVALLVSDTPPLLLWPFVRPSLLAACQRFFNTGICGFSGVKLRTLDPIEFLWKSSILQFWY